MTQPKINLLGDNNEILNKAKVAPKQQKSIFVILPDIGLSEIQLFNQYQITTDKIGSGSFAKIKVVKEHQSGKQFALKYVKTRGKTVTDINTFKKEILCLWKLRDHPNIIKLYDFCESTNGLYMVLEYCNGGDVAQKLEKHGKMSEFEARSITKQIVAGICYYHQFNIVHRDLKPDNLMYNNGVIKIIDFGLSGNCTNPLTTSCGTPIYAAPELIANKAYGTKPDMWSLGVMIYEFIAGYPPFIEKSGNQKKLLDLIKTGKFSFSKTFKTCHPSLRDLINKLLCLDAVRRLSAQQTRGHQWFTARIANNTKINDNNNRMHKKNSLGQNNMNNTSQSRGNGHNMHNNAQYQQREYRNNSMGNKGNNINNNQQPTAMRMPSQPINPQRPHSARQYGNNINNNNRNSGFGNDKHLMQQQRSNSNSVGGKPQIMYNMNNIRTNSNNMNPNMGQNTNNMNTFTAHNRDNYNNNNKQNVMRMHSQPMNQERPHSAREYRNNTNVNRKSGLGNEQHLMQNNNNMQEQRSNSNSVGGKPHIMYNQHNNMNMNKNCGRTQQNVYNRGNQNNNMNQQNQFGNRNVKQPPFNHNNNYNNVKKQKVFGNDIMNERRPMPQNNYEMNMNNNNETGIKQAQQIRVNNNNIPTQKRW